METKKYYYGLIFSSEEINLNKIRCMDLFAIVSTKLFPDQDILSNKELSIIIQSKEIKRIEIIRNKQNKYILDCRFYY